MTTHLAEDSKVNIGFCCIILMRTATAPLTGCHYGCKVKWTILSNGNVGIGTDSPSWKLDMKVASSGYDGISISDTQKIIEMGRDNTEGTGYIRIEKDGSSSVLLRGDGISYFNGGNVGIGTSSPLSKLDLAGTGGFSSIRMGGIGPTEGAVGTSSIGRQYNTNSSFYSAVNFISSSTEDYITFKTHKSGSSVGDRMIITGLGNVGIGTDEPQSILNLYTANPELIIQDTDTSSVTADSSLIFAESQASGAPGHNYRIRYNHRDLIFSEGDYPNNTTEVMRFYESSSGGAVNVGIGTTSPGEKLEVNGNIRCTGNLLMGGYASNGTPSKIHIGGSNSDIPSSSSDSALLRVGGDHDLNGTLFKIDDYNNDSNTSKVVWFESENAQTDYSFVADANGGKHYYRGKVGIGSTSPRCRLHVQADSSYTNSQRVNYFADNANDSLTSTSYNFTISIYGTNAIFAEDYIVASDERIKKNISVVPDDLSLTLLRNIECYYYNYIDNAFKQLDDNNTEKTIGFLAQQVAEHCELAVETIENVIPNEYRTIENPQWQEIDISGNTKYKLTINDLQGDYLTHTTYKFLVRNQESTGIIIDDEGNTILPLQVCKKLKTSIEDDANSFIFDIKWDNVFLFGHEVDDFHVLKKERLWAINFSASQEIDRIQQEEKTKLVAAEAKIAALEAENVSLKSRLDAIEARLNAGGL